VQVFTVNPQFFSHSLIIEWLHLVDPPHKRPADGAGWLRDFDLCCCTSKSISGGISPLSSCLQYNLYCQQKTVVNIISIIGHYKTDVNFVMMYRLKKTFFTKCSKHH